jgi:DNA-binding XRE family transcriptional regulator
MPPHSCRLGSTTPLLTEEGREDESTMHEVFFFDVGTPRRKVLDLTQAALAQRVRYVEVTIRKLEPHVFRLSWEMGKRLAIYLDLPADEHVGFLWAACGEAGR